MDAFEKDPAMFDHLQETSSHVQTKFSTFTHLKLRGDILSPIKHLYLKQELSSYEEEREVLEKISEEVKILKFKNSI